MRRKVVTKTHRGWRSQVAAMVIMVLWIVMTSTAADAQTLIGSPFITGWDGWTDVFDYSITPARSGWPGWGIMLEYPTLSECSDGNEADGLAVNDGLFKPYIMVNSNVTPSAYSIDATMISNDDDGVGLVFGYVDNDNYFRVTIRNQTGGASGVPQGIYLQKVVGGVITMLAGPDTGCAYPNSDAVGNRLTFHMGVQVNGSSYTVLAPDAIGDPMVYFAGSDADLQVGRYGFQTWAHCLDSRTLDASWGLEVEQMQVTSATLNKTHTFTNAWPVAFKKITMSRADGRQDLERTAFDQGNFRLDFRNGTIMENSQAYLYGSSVCATMNTDFTGPAMIVDELGAEEMEDVQMQLRLTSGDKDGLGMLLRVQQDDVDPNQLSFYRVHFSAVDIDANNRCPKGMSIQKCVAGGTGNMPVWTEIYRDDQQNVPFAFQYFTSSLTAIPFDVKVIVTNNEDDTATTIRVEVINDPNGTPTPYTWEVTDSNSPLLTGTVGLESWYASCCASGSKGFGSVFGGYGGDPDAALVVVPSAIPEIPGDADRDGDVDQDDAADMAAAWGAGPGSTWAMGDFNKDGYVNACDAAILAANYGYVWSGESESEPVPEPGTTALLLGALTALALGRRRR